jgi:hypothetical protein
MVLATWHCALAEWSPSGERDRLRPLVERAFAAIPGSLTLK